MKPMITLFQKQKLQNTFVPFLPFSVLFCSPSHESFSSCDTQKNNVMGKEKLQLCIKFLLYFPFATR